MKRILTIGFLLCLLILSASSSTVLLHNQWDDDNDPPETTTGGKKGHIEVVVDRTITDLGSSAKCFVSSTVLIEPAGTQDSSFVAFGQVRGIADKNSALNPLYIPPRVRWKKVSSTGVPEWISESELDRTRKTKFTRRPPAPNNRLLYSAAEKHSVGWTSDINLGFVKIPTGRKEHLELSQSAEITKTKLSGSGMGKAAVIAMFSPYAEAKGRATGAQQSHIPGVDVNTDMPIEDEDDENDNDEMGVASDDSTDGGDASDFISETLRPKPLPRNNPTGGDYTPPPPVAPPPPPPCSLSASTPCYYAGNSSWTYDRSRSYSSDPRIEWAVNISHISRQQGWASIRNREVYNDTDSGWRVVSVTNQNGVSNTNRWLGSYLDTVSIDRRSDGELCLKVTLQSFTSGVYTILLRGRDAHGHTREIQKIIRMTNPY